MSTKDKSPAQKFWKKFSLSKNKTSSTSSTSPSSFSLAGNPPPTTPIPRTDIRELSEHEKIKNRRLSGLFTHKIQNLTSQQMLKKRQSYHAGLSHSLSPPLAMFPFKAGEDLAHGYLLDEKSIHVQRLGELDPLKPQQQLPSSNIFEGRGAIHRSAGSRFEDHALSGTENTIHEEPEEKGIEHAENKREDDEQETNKEDESGITATTPVTTTDPLPSSPSPDRSVSVKKKTTADTNKKAIPRPTPSRSNQSQRSVARPNNKPSTTRLRKPSTVGQTRPRTPKLPESPKPVKSIENDSEGERRADSARTSTSLSVGSSATSDDTTCEPSSEEMLLKEELEKERAIIRVLQKQKEAINKDLDYFSQTVDELMNEKTVLAEKLEAEKLANQHKDEDLDLLLEKLKTATDNARDQSFAAEQARNELENYRRQALEERQSFQSQLNQKDNDINQLKSQLSQAQDQIRILTATMDQLIAAQVALAEDDRHSMKRSRPSSPMRYSGASSPEPQTVGKAMELIESTSIRSGSVSPAPSLPSSFVQYHDCSMKQLNTMERSDSSSNGSSSGQEDDLDHQLMRLTKEKEKLQSHYSKIPLTGGGHQSRRRKEELEEMLDEVDSQLSKVKQKIKRS